MRLIDGDALVEKFNEKVDMAECLIDARTADWRDYLDGARAQKEELFDRANADGDKELQAKLRNDFAEWCKKNGRTPLNPQAVQDWWNENVQWRNYNE